MGNTEKCPKCGGRMIANDTGYTRANVSNGFGAPLPESYSCIICGKYVEIAKSFDVDMSRPNRLGYPEERKPLGPFGWMRELVKKYEKEIVHMRSTGKYWEQVRRALMKKDERLKESTHVALCNAWRRYQRGLGQ